MRDAYHHMQRIIVTRYGPPEVLRLEEAETPAPAEGEVLVRVARAGINFADLLARMGLYPGVPKPPFVPGHEVAGTVAALGPAVDGLAVGDRVVAGKDLYGGTHRLFNRVMERFGVLIDYVDTSDPAVLGALPKDTRLLYIETPSNPLLTITSLEQAVAGARRVGAEVAVDNTFASPALQRPIEFGADYVIHSTTKYIAGHSDVVGGAVVVRDEAHSEDLWFHQNSAGTANSPFDAFLTLRGLRTLEVRIERHCANARALAEFLHSHPGVDRVLYPGLASHSGHAVAREQMSDFGGMLSFELPGGIPQSSALVKAVRIFQLAESLGGVESLIELPAPMTHASVPLEARLAKGITDGLVRLSVGIEDPADLIADLEQALAKVQI